MNKIKVVDYDPNWVQVFETLRDFLIPSISDIALTVEHIGSTSIAGR